MRRIRIATGVGIVLVALSTLVCADTLVLRDGTHVEGTVVSMTARTVTFRHQDGVSRRYPTSQVDSVTFVSADRANAKAPVGPTLLMPAGTDLRIRTTEMIDSRRSGVAQLFSGIVDEDVQTGNGVTVPKGASAQLLIRQVSEGSASPVLVLDIESITVAGRRYQTTIAPAITQGTSGVSAGSASGTVIASMKGSGTGFAGVLSASGEDTTEVSTRGPDVRVPAQTLLEFRLERAVMLQGRALGK
jgi:hypothetical protein